jgi:predicted dinucleotide-binding enzyme
MPSSPPLRIAVLGVGKIGSTFAFQLARTGNHDVTVICRALVDVMVAAAPRAKPPISLPRLQAMKPS